MIAVRESDPTSVKDSTVAVSENCRTPRCRNSNFVGLSDVVSDSDPASRTVTEASSNCRVSDPCTCRHCRVTRIPVGLLSDCRVSYCRTVGPVCRTVGVYCLGLRGYTVGNGIHCRTFGPRPGLTACRVRGLHTAVTPRFPRYTCIYGIVRE